MDHLDLINLLERNQRHGSKPRCHLLTHGSPDQVATRLTNLIAPWGTVAHDDKWMPQGFNDLVEAQLHEAPRLLPDNVCQKLLSWWLVVRARTPNWDIASTCTIGGKKGLLLVEAKAHETELVNAEKGRPLGNDSSQDRVINHAQIEKAIAQANAGLNSAVSGWNLSTDSHYQMVNRFAWSWKITELGFPVVLVYLGFLNAKEMEHHGKTFANSAQWESLVKAHSKPLFPETVWNQKLALHGESFIPLIRSVEWPL